MMRVQAFPCALAKADADARERASATGLHARDRTGVGKVPLYEYYCADCRSKFELLVSYAASEAD
ncbi:MAG TPA: hypothetical protein VGP82_13855, partial [Ktedonobacterales bacterium]|nr:hypothetical protein [Ktedonobacterales bacterium]